MLIAPTAAAGLIRDLARRGACSLLFRFAVAPRARPSFSPLSALPVALAGGLPVPLVVFGHVLSSCRVAIQGQSIGQHNGAGPLG